MTEVVVVGIAPRAIRILPLHPLHEGDMMQGARIKVQGVLRWRRWRGAPEVVSSPCTPSMRGIKVRNPLQRGT